MKYTCINLHHQWLIILILSWHMINHHPVDFFLAAAKRFGIKLGDTKRGTIESRRGDG